MGLTESTLAKTQLEALETQGKLEEGRPYGPHCPYELPLALMIEAPPPRPESSRVPPHMLQQLQQIPPRPPPEPFPWPAPMQPPPPQQQAHTVRAVVTSSGSSSASSSAHQVHHRAPPSRAATHPLMSSEPLYYPSEQRTIPYNQAPQQQVAMGAPQYRFYQPQYSVERTTLNDGHQQQQQQQQQMTYHHQMMQQPQHQPQHHHHHQPIAPPSLQLPPPTLQFTPQSPMNVEVEMQQQHHQHQQQYIRPSSSPAQVAQFVSFGPGEVPQFLSPQAPAAVFPPYLSPSAAPSLHMSPSPQPEMVHEQQQQQQMPIGMQPAQVYPTTTSTLPPPPAIKPQGTGAHTFRSPDVQPYSIGGPVAFPGSVSSSPATSLGAAPAHYVGELGSVPRAYPTDGTVPAVSTDDNHLVAQHHHGAAVGATGDAVTAAPGGGPDTTRRRGRLLRAGSGAGRGARAAPQLAPAPFHAAPHQPRSATADRYLIVPADRAPRRESTGSMGLNAPPPALRVVPPGMPVHMPFAAVVDGEDFRSGAVVAPSRRTAAAAPPPPLGAPRATRAVTCL